MLNDNEVNGLAKEANLDNAETAEEESEEDEGYESCFFPPVIFDL